MVERGNDYICRKGHKYTYAVLLVLKTAASPTASRPYHFPDSASQTQTRVSFFFPPPSSHVGLLFVNVHTQHDTMQSIKPRKKNVTLQLFSSNPNFLLSHLSKGSSGHKQKCTQFPTPFSGIVFHALSHGVIHFVRRFSFKNLEMEVCDWLLINSNQRESGFSS